MIKQAINPNLPGTGWLNQNIRQPPKPQLQQPAQTRIPANTFNPFASTNTQQPQQPNQFNFDFKSPQGFGTIASMMSPITKPILEVGGLPALMGIYGMMSGSQNWTKATTNQKPQPLYQNKTAALILARRKLAEANIPASSEESLWGNSLNTPMYTPSIPSFQNDSPTSVQNESPVPNSENTSNSNVEDNRIGEVAAKEFAIRPGVNYALKRTIDPSIQVFNKSIIPTASAIKNFFKTAPIVNSVFEAADLTGLHSPTKDLNSWQKPRLDARGNIIRDVQGNPIWDFGFNRDALGFNMKEFDKETTPNDEIFKGVKTPWNAVNYPLSYLTSAWNAAAQPWKSTYSLGKFVVNDMRPSNPDGIPRTTTKFIRNRAHRSGLSSDMIENEKQKWQKMRGDAYHPDYNPTGKGDSDQLPHIKRVLSSPIKQVDNFIQSTSNKGLLPTLRDAWLKNW